MNPMTELAPMLKQLRLSGILDSLESRNKQAIDKKMAYPEFLALLVSDEVARREQKRFATRLRRHFHLHASSVHRLHVDEKVAVLLAGPCGTGKSHIAQAIGHAAVRQGRDVLFTSQSQLLGSLHAARATDAYDRKFQNLVKVPLLIIDDFGLKPLRPPHDEDFHDLVAERYERTATVITSNLDFGEWGDAFPNQLLGAATLDRLRHGAYRVVLDGKSYRSPRPLDDPLEKQSKSGK